MSQLQCAIVTVASGYPAERLDHTFTSFAINEGVPLHAFILASEPPKRQLPGITYHVVEPVPDFSDPIREVYFRRHELIDRLGFDYVLVVDCYDMLCLQPLPCLTTLLGGCAVAACTEHAGGRYIMGQGYTANYLNGGFFLWDVASSSNIRKEVLVRGRTRFRNIVDDQLAVNEVIQTTYYDRLRILPCQYNFRADLQPLKRRGWPSVSHLNGVVVYHNSACIEAAKGLMPVGRRAVLPALVADGHSLTPWQQLWRRLLNRLQPHRVR